jgi:cytochrome P450
MDLLLSGGISDNWLAIIFCILVFAASFVFISEYIKCKDGNSMIESYPFETTVTTLRHLDRVLDLMQEGLEEHTKNNGGSKTMKIRMIFQPQMILTNSIENITHILKTNMTNYGKGPTFSSKFHALLGDGIFNTDGKEWYNHRKTSSHLFNLNKFKTGVLDTFNTHADSLLGVLHAGPKTDIQSLMFKFTLDSIGVIAFGVNIGALGSDDKVQFAEDFDYCQESVNNSFFDPLWLLKRYLTPGGWRYFLALRRIDAFAYDVVRQKRAAIARLSPEEQSDDSLASRNGRDLLSLYLSRQDKENGGILSDKYLRDVVLNFMIAGRDTTAQALSWSFFLLCCNPDEQVKVQSEVDTVLAAHSEAGADACACASACACACAGGGHISFAALQDMRYLECCIMEVLRLYPSVPKEAKHAYGPDTLPDGTVIKGGELVSFAPYIMGRDPTLWEDPLAFRPARFASAKPSPFVFTAFQAGPRICLGQNMAILEMKLVLARVFREFTVRLGQERQSVTYRNSITLPIKGGLRVCLTPRK